MSPSLSDRCNRIAADLDFLAVEFIHGGHRGAAYRVLDMASTLLGGSLFGDDTSPAQAAEQLTTMEMEGGAA